MTGSIDRRFSTRLLASAGLWAVLGSFAAGQDPAVDPDAPAAAPAPVRAATLAGQAVLDTNPKTPAELLRAIELLVDLGEAPAAKDLIGRFNALGLDVAAKADWGERLGPSFVVKLASTAALQPEGKALSDDLIGETLRRAVDPAHLDTVLQELASSDPDVAARAVQRLRFGRNDAQAALFNVLADASRAAEHARCRTALVAFGDDARGASFAAVRSGDATLAMNGIAVLEARGDAESLTALLAPALGPGENSPVKQAARAALVRGGRRLPLASGAADSLLRQSLALLESVPAYGAPTTTNEPRWSWNAEARKLEFKPVGTARHLLGRAADLADDSAALAGEPGLARRIALLARVESLAGADLDELDRAVAGTAVELEQALEEAERRGRPGAMVGALNLLARRGSSVQLAGLGREPGVVTRFLDHPDRTVRFAAAEAVMALRPADPYPGSSKLAATLVHFVRTAGGPQAVLADFRLDEATRLGALVAEMGRGQGHPNGYEIVTATNPGATVRAAIGSADVELVLIEHAMAAPQSGRLIQQLRRDPRTARLPVLIVAGTEEFDAAVSLARGIPLCQAILRPLDAAGLELQARQFLAERALELGDVKLRKEQARRALVALGVLTDEATTLYDWHGLESALLPAVYDPELGPLAIRVLGALPSHEAQTLLVDLASQTSAPLALRQAAVAAFAAGTERHGTLLSRSEIRRQYDRYNESEALDAATQQLRAAVLDAIEVAADKHVGPVRTSPNEAR
jgi:hypothetical protein